MSVPPTLLLSRTDAIGDAMVTMPMAGWIKKHAPHVHLIMLAREYTRSVWEHCAHVDRVITLEELARQPGSDGAARMLAQCGAQAIIHVFPRVEVARWAKAAGIPMRIGTAHRWWHWYTCTHRVAFSRKRSNLHEAQLNLKLLAPLMTETPPALPELAELTGFDPPAPSEQARAWLRPGTPTVILHPGSKGSAVEWGLENFASLIRTLSDDGRTVIVTGTSAEADRYRTVLPLDLPGVIDAGGVLPLPELVSLIGASDALVAASTGPLHIAAACGIRAIGLYSPRRPIHPGRWAPLGRDAHALVFDPACPRCAAGRPCDCITRISPQRVADLLRDLPEH